MPLILPSTAPADNAGMSADPAVAMERLTHPDAGTRRDAAHALLGNPDAVASLVAALDTEQDGAVRHAVLSALVSIADAATAAALVCLLRSEDAARRSEAVTALQQMPEACGEVIDGLLDDPDPDLRIMAVDVIRLLPEAQAPAWLRKLIARETHPNVVGVAVDRFAEIGGPEDLDILREVRTRFADDPFLGFATEMVIERIEILDREAGP